MRNASTELIGEWVKPAFFTGETNEKAALFRKSGFRELPNVCAGLFVSGQSPLLVVFEYNFTQIVDFFTVCLAVAILYFKPFRSIGFR